MSARGAFRPKASGAPFLRGGAVEAFDTGNKLWCVLGEMFSLVLAQLRGEFLPWQLRDMRVTSSFQWFLFCGWVLCNLRPFWALTCLYGWAFSKCLMQFALRKSKNDSDKAEKLWDGVGICQKVNHTKCGFPFVTNDGFPLCTHLLQLMATDQSGSFVTLVNSCTDNQVWWIQTCDLAVGATWYFDQCWNRNCWIFFSAGQYNEHNWCELTLIWLLWER